MFEPRAYASSAAILGLMWVAGCTQAAGNDRPAAVQALEAEGLAFVQEFDVGGGLRGFAGMAGDNPLAIYVTADGKAIVGTRLNEKGEPLDEATVQKRVAKPMAEQTWAQLESSTWVRDGKADAPRIIYTFSDPNCPYCNRFWEAARPWVDSGKVQLRHMLVGLIRADSPTKAAAILEAPDRSAALLDNERNFARGGIKPAAAVSEATRSALDANQRLMTVQGFRGTPGIIVRDRDGVPKKYRGMPQAAALAEVLGPR